jgi:purine-nucleoside phosphorylase
MMTTALDVLKQRFPNAKPRVAVVLGSGWAEFTDRVDGAQRISYSSLPGFPEPSVQGHAADLVVGRLGAHEVVVLTGRKHAYETGEPNGMVTPLTTLRVWGCEVLIQTNAAGSLQAEMPTGSLMMLTDHINFAQRSPLTGVTGSERFVNMVNAYDPTLRAQAADLAKAAGQQLYQGAYVWFLGPQFETPAEIRMFKTIGADAVGMSTVPETIIGRYLGMRVLAFSMITNMAAGLSSEVLSHAHTLEQGALASSYSSQFLADVVKHMQL